MAKTTEKRGHELKTANMETEWKKRLAGLIDWNTNIFISGDTTWTVLPDCNPKSFVVQRAKERYHWY